MSFPLPLLRFKFQLVLMLLCAVLLAVPKRADALRLIRDAEIEATLRLIADPILRAAGLSPRSIRIIIVDDTSLNAFVAGRQTMFINSGMLMRLDTVPKIQAVIAHEAAHIAAGHLISLNTKNTPSSAMAIGALLAGMAAATGNRDAAAALALGGTQVATRSRLAHSRAAEAAADQASVRYLAKAGIDPQAALDTLDLFRGQEVLSRTRIDPYAQTHPLTAQRISYLRDAVRSAKVRNIAPHKNLDYWYKRMQAKFDGFVRNPRSQLSKLPKRTNDELVVYRRAIANHRMSNLKAAQNDIAALLRHRPNDAYYHELSGQFYLAAGQAKSAVTAYRQAAKFSKGDALILAGLGRALLALDTNAATKEALKVLEKSRQSGFPDAQLFQNLAMAYSRLGQNGRASLAISERYALSGRMDDAGLHARRALGLLAEGTPSWRRANDIARAAKTLSAKRK